MTGPTVYLMMFLALFSSALAAEPEYKRMGPDIFDRQIQGELLIEKAIERAGREHKHILLFFGANWCPWCRQLHHALTEDKTIVATLRKDFVLVYIDANTRNDKKRNATVIERYGNPLQYGLPAWVVLDQDGVQLATQETSSLSAPSDEEVARRILAVLKKWAPPSPPGAN